jgi:hypothetical protein
MATPEGPWTFERVKPNAAGSSGKISDLFRNEGVEQRGHLAAGAPAPAATLMAREVIQNSWDAAQELRRDDATVPPFYLDFVFKRLEGDDKEQLVDALGLRQLAAHAADVDQERNKLGLGTDDCLRNLDERRDLDYCEIIEHGAKGMYGPWSGAKSRMYLAMLSIGYNEKADGSGGTFGYGKAGLIRASHPRVVVAYSCFPEQANDPGITRRLLGVTYWGRHDDNEGHTLNGFVRFGERVSPDDVRPFENDDADEVAAALGFEVRSANEVEQLGTTFLVLDPAVEASDLREAVERNWWPALLHEKFTVLVTEQGGAEHACRPRKNPELGAYVGAYDLLQADTENGPNERLVDLGTYAPQGEPSRRLGRLALVADPSSWSFPDDIDGADSGVDHRSLVALTRTPRMVVEYHLPGRDISRRTPYVRGFFMADDEVNAHLALTEPKAHDRWDNQRSDDVEPAATAIAATLLDRIRIAVRDFQDALRPPVDEAGAVRLLRLDEKLKKLGQPGGKPPPPPPGERPFSFALDVGRRASDGQLVLAGKVTVALAPGAPSVEVESRIRLAFAIEEDGRRGDAVPLKVKPPSGFRAVGGDATRFVGSITRTAVTFEIESDPYRDDWTGELLVSGEVVDGATA